MLALGQVAESCGLERSLLQLVKMRTSQVNRCAYCLDMHAKDARALGESEHLLSGDARSIPISPRAAPGERLTAEGGGYPGV